MHPETLRRWHKTGIIRGAYDRSKGRWQFKLEDLRDFIDERGLQSISGFFSKVEGKPLTPPKLAKELGITVDRVHGMIARNELTILSLPPGPKGRRTLLISGDEAERVKKELENKLFLNISRKLISETK